MEENGWTPRQICQELTIPQIMTLWGGQQTYEVKQTGPAVAQEAEKAALDGMVVVDLETEKQVKEFLRKRGGG